MKVNAGISEGGLPGDLDAQVEPRWTDSKAPSVASSDDGTEASEEKIMDDIVVLRVEADKEVEQDESALLVGPLFETPATPPLLPMRPIISDLMEEYQPHISPPHTHVLLPSEGAGIDGQSARTNPARESPSHRFFASPDQIDALGMPRTWVHGQVISTLGDTFCYPSRSKPRHEQYDILPTHLFDLWNQHKGDHTELRTCLSYHFKQATSPLECRAWLVPVLLQSHWYLLALDWIHHKLHVYDSLATNKVANQSLVRFGSGLLKLITEDLDMEECIWEVVPEQVSNFHRSFTRF